MNSSFLSTLTAVLSEQDEIENLPNNQLIAKAEIGEVVEKTIPRNVLHKLVRLQTLLVKENEKSETPGYATVKSVAQMTDSSIEQTMLELLEAPENNEHRVEMLEGLIVEVVRDAFPAERNRCGVEYFAHVSGVIMRREIKYQRRFE